MGNYQIFLKTTVFWSEYFRLIGTG